MTCALGCVWDEGIRCKSGAVRTSTVFADEKYSLKAAIALLSEKVYFKVEALVGRPAVYMVLQCFRLEVGSI